MQIIHISPPFIPLQSELAYGGTERIIMRLSAALNAEGIRNLLIAPSDSRMDNLLPTIQSTGVLELYQPYTAQNEVRTNSYRKLAHVAFALQYCLRHEGVVHIHDDYFLPFQPFLKRPSIFTVYNQYPDFWKSEEFPTIPSHVKNIIAISNTNKETLESHGYSVRDVIYLGMDTRQFPLSTEKKDFYLTLGVISPHKGQHLAIEAAIKAKVPLIIAGNIGHQDYFEKQILPHLTHHIEEKDKIIAYSALPAGPKIVYVGSVNDEQKLPLYQNAKAFLMPTQCDEPLPMVNAEALSTGTAIIGTPYGSVPEVILQRQAYTGGFVRSPIGFVVPDAAGMCQAIQEWERTSLEERIATAISCRTEAEDQFSIATWTKKHIDLYHHIQESI